MTVLISTCYEVWRNPLRVSNNICGSCKNGKNSKYTEWKLGRNGLTVCLVHPSMSKFYIQPSMAAIILRLVLWCKKLVLSSCKVKEEKNKHLNHVHFFQMGQNSWHYKLISLTTAEIPGITNIQFAFYYQKFRW